MRGQCWVFLMLFVFFLAGCFSAKIAVPGEVVQLFQGETVTFEGSELSIWFVKVIEDSRCPEGAICLWEGRMVILLEIREGQRREKREISLQASQLPHEERVDEFLLTISAFGPPRKLGQDDVPPQYYLVLSFTRR
ncbi:MAG: hypothetical protein HPY68_11410 [Candidatus Atribacteria bacterium]|nr:hypothetical protein [Candidatus Atribacteria bacterium]